MTVLLTKKLLRCAGSGIGILGVLFVTVTLWSYRATLAPERFGWHAWISLGLLALAYGCSGSLLALAWRDLLRYFGAAVSRSWALGAYGVSQLAKYLPGNVFHLLGRQALGAGAGISAWVLAKSAVWELGGLCLAGSLFCISAMPLVFSGLGVGAAAALFAIVLFTCAWIAFRRFGAALARVICWHAAFLALSGLMFIGVLLVAVPGMRVAPLWPALCGAYVVAWLAGLLTPGAPAGIGVREAALFALLQPIIDPTGLLAAIVLARAVTVLGDLIFYAIAAAASFAGAMRASRLQQTRRPPDPIT